MLKTTAATSFTVRTFSAPPKERYAPAVFGAEDGFTKTGLMATVAMSVLALAPRVGMATDMGSVLVKQNPDAGKIFDQQQTNVGDGYVLNFQPADLNLTPKLNHFKPGVNARGDLLSTSLVKTEAQSDGSTTSFGLRGRVHGEWTTYANGNSNNILLEGFNRWDKVPVFSNVKGTFEISAGPMVDVMNHTNSLGFHAVQELNGGHFEVADHNFNWRMEAHEDVGYVVGGLHSVTTDGVTTTPSRLQHNATLFAGAGKEYPISVFGRQAKIVATVGPYFQSDSTHAFKVSPKADVKVRF